MAAVPAPTKFYEPDELRLAFPQVFNDPELPGGPVWGLVFDRIAPVSEGYRRHLISRYVDPKLQPEALAHPKNQYGLLMLYLGTKHGRPATDPKVGNRPLSFPQLLGEIGREGVVELAETMAATLAVLHWSAHLDGQHVRFVAGHQPSRHHRTVYLSHIQRLHPFSPDGETVASRLVANFLANKSWPRPVVSTAEASEEGVGMVVDEEEEERDDEGKDDAKRDGLAFRREVWRAFRSLYLDMAAYVIYRDKDVLGEEYVRRARLPALLIRALEALSPANSSTNSTATSVDSSSQAHEYKRTPYDDYRERGPRPGDGEGSRMGPSRVWGCRLRAGEERRGESMQFVVRKERELMDIEEEGGRGERDERDEFYG